MATLAQYDFLPDASIDGFTKERWHSHLALDVWTLWQGRGVQKYEDYRGPVYWIEAELDLGSLMWIQKIGGGGESIEAWLLGILIDNSGKIQGALEGYTYLGAEVYRLQPGDKKLGSLYKVRWGFIPPTESGLGQVIVLSAIAIAVLGIFAISSLVRSIRAKSENIYAGKKGGGFLGIGGLFSDLKGILILAVLVLLLPRFLSSTKAG